MVQELDPEMFKKLKAKRDEMLNQSYKIGKKLGIAGSYNPLKQTSVSLTLKQREIIRLMKEAGSIHSVSEFVRNALDFYLAWKYHVATPKEVVKVIIDNIEVEIIGEA